MLGGYAALDQLALKFLVRLGIIYSAPLGLEEHDRADISAGALLVLSSDCSRRRCSMTASVITACLSRRR